VILFFRERNQT